MNLLLSVSPDGLSFLRCTLAYATIPPIVKFERQTDRQTDRDRQRQTETQRHRERMQKSKEKQVGFKIGTTAFLGGGGGDFLQLNVGGGGGDYSWTHT